MSFKPGQFICHDKYEILALIGEGSFARVWQAREPGFGNRLVAIKELKREELTTEEIRRSELRFGREMQIAAAIREHGVPFVVLTNTVEQLPETGERLLVMDFMPGGSLEGRIKNQPDGMPPLEALDITLSICKALAAFHRLPGLQPVHRDIKPSNILFSAGGVAHLADFGVAQVHGDTIAGSRTRGTAEPHPGSIEYMAPEQESELGYLRPAADIFALGCVLFEMLTGQLYKRQRTGAPPSAFRSGLPSQLDAVLARALAQRPDDRYESAEAFAEALQPLRDELVAEQKRREQISNLRRRADSALESRDLVTARQAVTTWLALSPDDAEALGLRARIGAAEREETLAAEIAGYRRSFEAALKDEKWPAARTALASWERVAPHDLEPGAARRRLAQAEADAALRARVASLRQRAEAALAAGNWCRAQRAARDWERLEPTSQAMRAVLLTAEQMRGAQAGGRICLPLLDVPVPIRMFLGVSVFLFVAFSVYWLLFVFLPGRGDAADATATAAATAETTPTLTSNEAAETAVAPTKTVVATEPTVTPESTDTPVPTPSPTPITYTVQAGDTLPSIAARYGVDAEELAELNNLADPNAIIAGQVLTIPHPTPVPAFPHTTPVPALPHTTYTVQAGDTLASIATLYDVPVDQLAAFNGIEVTAALQPGDVLNIPLSGHVVIEGETTDSIAEQYSVSLDSLIALNAGAHPSLLDDPNFLLPGWFLQIPRETVVEGYNCDPDPEPRQGVITHTVSFGMELACLSRKFGLEVNTLAWANRAVIVDGGLQDGDVIKVPPADGALYVISENDIASETSVEALATYYGVTSGDILTESGEPVTDPLDEVGQLLFIRNAYLLDGPYVPPLIVVSPTATTDNNQPPTDAELGDTWLRPADGMTMVYVPASSFLMGSLDGDSEADSDEFPQHQVTLDGFWIDRTEVSNEHYERCVTAGNCVASSYANDTTFNGVEYPVVGVSWNDADLYCQWAGGRLPTEAEWEYAARGPDGNRYPWGDTFDGDLTNFCDVNCLFNWADDVYDDGYALTAPIGSFPAWSSWVGALDMAGNVWEWVQDWYDSEYYATSPSNNPTGPPNGSPKVLRGGGWNYDRLSVRSANRVSILPEVGNDYIGFRCVVPQAVDS